MLKFFKEKLKSITEKFSKDEVLDETDELVEETIIEEPTKNTETNKTEKSKKELRQEEKQTRKEEKKAEKEEKQSERQEKKQERIEKIQEKKVSVKEEKFDDLFWDLEIELLEFNVASEVIEQIKTDLKKELVENKIDKKKLTETINQKVMETIESLLMEGPLLEDKAKEKKPYIILFLGVNGSGKTTSLAKVASYLKDKGFTSVIAACDTFRAAAIQQVEEHANNLGIKLVKHDYGSDAAAVAFDAIKHAEASGKDFVLIDTAGRNHSNTNLMDELKKVVRISNPDMKVFVADSLTGNDAVEQATSFNEKIGIDNVILTKTDTDEKGGAIISVSYVTKKPILFLGTGQEYSDLKSFNKKEFMEFLNKED